METGYPNSFAILLAEENPRQVSLIRRQVSLIRPTTWTSLVLFSHCNDNLAHVQLVPTYPHCMRVVQG